MNDGLELPIRFAECSWNEFSPHVRANAVLLLPVGSTEAHGPHLPLGTDVLISEAMADAAAWRLRSSGIPSFVLPAVAYSVTEFAADFTGSISIRFETARAVLTDVCRSLLDQGFVRICIANSHLEPGHVDSILAAVEDIRSNTGIEIAFPDKRRRRWASMLTDEFRSGACHAGQYEGSVVLAVRPDLVREEVRSALPEVDISLVDAIREGKRSFREAGGELAYFGKPRDASAVEGRQTIELLADMLLRSLDETYGPIDGIQHVD
jgi:creatinine amidohydrolase